MSISPPASKAVEAKTTRCDGEVSLARKMTVRKRGGLWLVWRPIDRTNHGQRIPLNEFTTTHSFSL